MTETKHNFKKKYGQNFINDKSIIKRIVSAVPLQEDDLVIEIGPGAGIMTKKLVDKCSVLAYEIDKDLEKILLNNVNSNRLNVIWDDFLNRNVLDDLNNYKYNHLYIIANLPYYITTPIITKIIQEKVNPSRIVVMVQKEVADRFSSLPGTKEYGSITVYLNYHFNIKKLFNVSRNSFYPKPNVDSAVISLEPNEINSNIDENDFFEFVRDAFQHKRKTIKNNLYMYNLDKIDVILKKHGYSLTSRAEQIPLDVFIELYQNK